MVLITFVGFVRNLISASSVRRSQVFLTKFTKIPKITKMSCSSLSRPGFLEQRDDFDLTFVGCV